MTSAINYSLINTAFPVAGQDNNSQGFRDNFTAISAALAEAAAELTALQANSVIVRDLATSSVVQTNNLLGSTIYNGLYSQFNGAFYNLGNITNSGALVNLNNGPVQRAILTASATLTFENWGPIGTYSSVKLILQGDQSSLRTVTFATTNSGVMRAASGWTTIGGTSTYTSGGAIGASTVTLTSGTGLAPGQLFTGTGVLPNCYIVSITGSTTATLTLSDPFYAQAAGTYTSYAVGPVSPVTLTVDANEHLEVIDAWTVDGGAHVYLKNTGEYSLV